MLWYVMLVIKVMEVSMAPKIGGTFLAFSCAFKTAKYSLLAAAEIRLLCTNHHWPSWPYCYDVWLFAV